MFGANSKKTVLRAAVSATAIMLAGGVAMAAEEQKFDIGAQPLGKALLEFNAQSGQPVAAPRNLVKGRVSHGVSGTMQGKDALDAMLKDSGLKATELPNGAYTITLAALQVEDTRSGAAPVASVPTATQEEEQVDEVVVTGSRIPRDPANSPMPIVAMDAQDLFEIGTPDLAEALTTIPGISDDISPSRNIDSVQNTGLSSISMRNLGPNRTLTLLNGRRVVSNAGNANRVSLTSLPEGLIKRVDRTTGGASAVYGSDAIAGVINVTLEDSFVGVQLHARHDIPQASGGEQWVVDGRTGAKFADDKGYILVAASHRDDGLILADETRPASIADVEFRQAHSFLGESCGTESSGRRCFLGSGERGVAGGRFEIGRAWFADGQWYNTRDGVLPDRPRARDRYHRDQDGLGLRIGEALRPVRGITNFALHTTYEITPDTKASLTALYNNVTSTSVLRPRNLSHARSWGHPDVGRMSIGTISGSHPFIPDEIRSAVIGSVSWDRLFTEVGNSTADNDRTTMRFMADFEGTLFDSFDWEVFGTYGRYKQEQSWYNHLNRQRVQNALRIESDGAGGYQCSNEAARAEGCVPLNIFGEGSISVAAADYIRYNSHVEQLREQYTAGGHISGSIFSMPAGDVQFVAGVEYRSESQQSDGDPDGDPVGGLDGDPTTNDYRVTTLTPFPSFAGSFDVFEAYGEIDAPLFDGFNLQLAGRVGSYSTAGEIFSYNTGFTYRPVDDLMLRAQFSRSQRAPGLAELFSPPRPNGGRLEDPCNGLLADGTGITQVPGLGGENADPAVVASNCMARPGIQAYFANPDNVDPATGMVPEFQGVGSVRAPNAGNPNLGVETANTFTAGFTWQPSAIEGLTFTADYYRIAISDVVDRINTQNTATFCYAATDFPNNRFCNGIIRNQVTGNIEEVIGFAENLSERNVAGLDMSINYRGIELAGVPGEFDVVFNYTHDLRDQYIFFGLGDAVLDRNNLGFVGNGNDEFFFRAGYTLDGLRVSYTAIYDDGGLNDPINHPNPTDDRYYQIDGQSYHNLFASYSFGADDNYQIYGGINNLLNDHGPFMPLGLNAGNRRNIVGPLNHPVGREFYFGVRATF